MKSILRIFISSKMMLLLLLVFMAATATATFIEEKYDTQTARLLVYNARWFEILLVLLALNFIGHINRYKLMRKGKFGGLVFHLAFIILILGAGVTRYIGYEGTMHIREGESSNILYTSEPYFQAVIEEKGGKYNHDFPFYTSALKKNSFHFKMETGESGAIDFRYRGMIKNAIDTLIEHAPGGTAYLKLVLAGENGRENLLLRDGEIAATGHTVIAFNNGSRQDAIRITGKNGRFQIRSPHEIMRTRMPEMTMDTIFKNEPAAFERSCLHEIPETGLQFVLAASYDSAVKKKVQGTADQSDADALQVDVTVNGHTHTVEVLGGDAFIAGFQDAAIGALNLKMAYGKKAVVLPFQIGLDDFILERYPGSMSPSSFASEITLEDHARGITEKHRIFMNNVLDYGGYRFFQSSYDRDERGTILSVNHDFWGTTISYAGYLLLAVGFLFTLLSKSSHYASLRHRMKDMRLKSGTGVWVIAGLLLATPELYAQNRNQNISPAHADRFARLIVQTNDGRFEPVHTLAMDVLHKISRQNRLDIPGRGEMNAVQVLLDMPLNAAFWKQQKIIYIREAAVRAVLGISGRNASFNDFLDQDNNYKLADFVNTAFRKKPAEQNTFDREIIKADERANIMMMVLQGSLLKLFPVKGMTNNTWISWNDSLALIPLTGNLSVLNDDLQLQDFNYRNLFGHYLTELVKAAKTGDYAVVDRICGYFNSIQRQSPAQSLLPSPGRAGLEIVYNEAGIFEWLRNIYGLLGAGLLTLALVDLLRSTGVRWLNRLLNLFSVLLILAFVYHTAGLGLRWYLTGHAPWSNGYEALLLISWAGLLAGISFMRYSKITLAATAWLAFFILMTAGHSSYDPQLTNLQPVLKSYWLIIHVATLTISYGFLGLGFILALINIMLMIFRTGENETRLNAAIGQLTCINEMNLTVGVFLATLGTFLGGVWANESWGRYWGWDAKETWALIIVIAYTLVLHFRLVPKLKGEFIFNAGAVIAFGSVLMTFIGVNYYLSKGLHSYASGDTPVFPWWAWASILVLTAMLVYAGIRDASLINKPKGGQA